MKLTKEIFEKGLSCNGGYNSKQMQAIGERQTSGWRKRCIGKEVTPEQVRLFLEYKDYHYKDKPEKREKLLMKKGFSVNIKPVFIQVTKALSFSDQYLHPNWQKMRLYILNRDKFTCVDCGNKESTLHAHHLKYIPGRFVWDVPPFYIVTLCEDCHSKEHGRDLKAKK